jgi:hypothetical protein
MMLKYVFFGAFYYVAVPFALFQGSFMFRVGTAFALQLAVYGLWTTMALLMNSELTKNWRLLLALPCAPLYTLVYSFWTTFTGVIHDVFLFGNVTKFAPESTLIKGDSRRVAILARVRRVLVLAVRATVYGDVPFGRFWFGWSETAWTPSGYHGWTSGRRPTLLERLRFARVAPAAARPSLRVVQGLLTSGTSIAPPSRSAPGAEITKRAA